MEVDMLINNSAAVTQSGDYTSVQRPKTETAQQTPKSQQSQTSVGQSVNEYEYVSELKYDKEDYDGLHIKPESDYDGKGSMEILERAIEEANKKIIGYSRQFQYSVHEKTRQIMVKIINMDTNEVVKELPPEKTLDAVAKMWELAGILVDEKR